MDTTPPELELPEPELLEPELLELDPLEPELLELDPLEPELLELDRLDERPSTVLEFPLSTAESLRNAERRQSPTPSGTGPRAAATASASTRRPASVG